MEYLNQLSFNLMMQAISGQSRVLQLLNQVGVATAGTEVRVPGATSWQ